MKFRHLALKNVKGNWHRYIAFFLSCTFSVMIFYIFASFIYHPDVMHGHIRGGENVRGGLQACEYIIIIFSFFFVLYSESAFIKSRKKEFGLLSLFGMTTGQIRKLVFYEHTLIAVLSILSGMGLGTIFSKLFLMTMGTLLRVKSPIRFEIVPEAIIITVVGFLGIFILITLFLLIGVGRSEIIELLKAARKPKQLPVFSKWLVALSIVALGAGYGMACISDLSLIGYLMLPVLGLVVLGTYFLFTQGSVAVFRRLQKQPGIFYKETNLVTLSQLIFKMRDNARVLFMVAVLGAVVMTASGTFYILQMGTLNSLNNQFPQTFGFAVQGKSGSHIQNQVNQILNKNGEKVASQVRVNGLDAQAHFKAFNNGNKTALVVSNQDYNHAAQKVAGVNQVHLQEGHALYIQSMQSIKFFEKGDSEPIVVNGKTFTLKMDGERKKGVISDYGQHFGTMVISNQQYHQLKTLVPKDQQWTIYGYNLKNWRASQPVIKKIQASLPKSQTVVFVSKVQPYLSAKQYSSLTLFIGVFVSLLFFIASGSMIYFKLFTELQEDKMQYDALRRIGITEKEVRRIVTRQIAMIFFVPFIVGAVHALFAFKMLSDLNLFSHVWSYGGIVIAIYFMMQLFYFLLTRLSYVRQLAR